MNQEPNQEIIQENKVIKKRDKKAKQNDQVDNNIQGDQQQNAKIRCDQCGKDIAKNYYTYHIKHVHEKKRHDCLYCDKSFSDKSNLSHHVKDKHKDAEKIQRQPSYERKEICGKCNRGFKNKETLRIHGYNCDQLLLKQVANDPKQSKLNLKQRKHDSVEDLENQVKAALEEEQKDHSNLIEIEQQIHVSGLNDELNKVNLLNMSAEFVVDDNILDSSIAFDKTEDQSAAIEFHQIQKQIQQKPKASKALQWIPQQDDSNFNDKFIENMYHTITKESNILWPVDKLPDQSIPLTKSTRMQTAQVDAQWKESEQNLVKNSNVSTGYGEATQQSIDKIIKCYQENGFNSNSIFLDIGSGFGKVVFHVAAATHAQSYGIEIQNARHDYSIEFLMKLTEVEDNHKLRDIIKKVHFELKDAGKCEKYQDFEGRDITHIYCFNAVFTPESNELIAGAISRTAGVQMLSWCLDSNQTAKLGLVSFQLVNSYKITLQGSGTSRQMYIYKRSGDLDDSKLEMIKEQGLGQATIDQIKDKIETQQLQKDLTQQQIDREHNRGIADQLIAMANYLHFSILPYHKVMSVKQFITKYSNSSKVKSLFYSNDTIKKNLLLLSEITEYDWFRVQVIKKVESIYRQDFKLQIVDIRMDIEKHFNQDNHALTDQHIYKNLLKLEEYIKLTQQKVKEYELKIKVSTEIYEQMKSPYKDDTFTDSSGLEVEDKDFTGHIDFLLVGYNVVDKPTIDWQYIKQADQERLNSELIILKDIEKQYRAIQAKIEKFKQFTVTAVQKQKETAWINEDFVREFNVQVMDWLKEHHKIAQSNINFVAQGSTGRIYKIKKGSIKGFKQVVAPFAIKVCLKKDKILKQELTALKQIHSQKSQYCKYLMKSYGDFPILAGHAILMPYYPYNLEDLLKQKKIVSKQLKNNIASCILKGISAMHAVGVVHRDIKPENILMTDDMSPVICDFGFSPDLIECGTTGYMAPELYQELRQHQIDLFKADSWSVGVVLYNIYNDDNDIYGGGREEDFAVRSSKELNLKFHTDVTPDAQDLIKSLLQRDPRKRLTMEQAINHRLFKTLQLFGKKNIIDLTSPS